jgi:hypothetical protein
MGWNSLRTVLSAVGRRVSSSVHAPRRIRSLVHSSNSKYIGTKVSLQFSVFHILRAPGSSVWSNHNSARPLNLVAQGMCRSYWKSKNSSLLDGIASNICNAAVTWPRLLLPKLFPLNLGGDQVKSNSPIASEVLGRYSTILCGVDEYEQACSSRATLVSS